MTTGIREAPSRSVGGIDVVKYLTFTWSPVDVIQDETDAGVIVLPAPCVLIGGYWKRVTPTDAGSTPTLEITDDQGILDGGAFNLKSDDLSVFGAKFAVQSYLEWSVALSSTTPGGVALYVPLSFTFTYVAGLTPGATKPVIKLALVYVPTA